MDIDFEIEQMIVINNLIHRISYSIRKIFLLEKNNFVTKKIFHITFNWFMYHLGLKKTFSSHLLEGLGCFDYTQFIIDIYNYCQGYNSKKYSISEITYKFQLNIPLFIVSEFQKTANYLTNYKSVTGSIEFKELDGYCSIIYNVKKKYTCRKYQNIFTPNTVQIKKQLYSKLKARILSGKEDINHIIFVTLTRYKIYDIDLIGNSLSIDEIYFNSILKDKLTLEMFASPINCHLTNFCSIFPDIEHYYGSVGTSFTYETDMNFWLKQKIVVCNPPYCTQIMTRMAEMIKNIVTHCIDKQHNINFVIIVPDWRNGSKYYDEYEVYTLLKPYIKKEIVKKGNFLYFDYFDYKNVSLGTTDTLCLLLASGELMFESENLLKN